VQAVEVVSCCGCDDHFSTNMKTKILIVEDDPHILLGLEEILKSEGFEVSVCNRGDKAAESRGPGSSGADRSGRDAAGLNGFDVCKQLRAKKFTGAVLMLTAKGRRWTK